MPYKFSHFHLLPPVFYYDLDDASYTIKFLKFSFKKYYANGSIKYG